MYRIKKWFESISTKIVIIICVVIIPLNIMLIIISRRMINNQEQALISSYQNELTIYMTRVDNALLDIEREIKGLMQKNWPEFSPGAEGYELARYTVWKELKLARMNLDMVDGAYLKTNWDNWVVFTYPSC